MRTMSFADGFIEKRISIEMLMKLLEVEYQKKTLCELAFDNFTEEPLTVEKENDFIVKLENDVYKIFILLNSAKPVLEQAEKIPVKPGQKKFLIAFSNFKNKRIPEQVKLIDPKDWMNAIISHGIDRRILHLQYMRDLEFNWGIGENREMEPVV